MRGPPPSWWWVVFGKLAAPQPYTHGAKDWPMNTATCMRMRRRAWHWILPPFRAPVVLAGYCHCGLGLPLSHADTGPARVHMWPWCRWMMPLSRPMATLLCHVHTIHSRLPLLAARSACLLLAGGKRRNEGKGVRHRSTAACIGRQKTLATPKTGQAGARAHVLTVRNHSPIR